MYTEFHVHVDDFVAPIEDFEPDCCDCGGYHGDTHVDFARVETCRCCIDRECTAAAVYGIFDGVDAQAGTVGEVYCQTHALSEVDRRIEAGDREFGMLLLPEVA